MFSVPEKIKKVLKNPLLRRRVLLGLSILIILGLAFPQISCAQKWLQGVANSLFNALLGAIFSILLTVTEFFLKFASMLLGWVTSPDFVSVSYTGMDNPIIAEGWTRIRNLANMFFIIGLVVIGIATALRIKEYQAKKALPKLIIIALLVNFTPVITGVIIDGANIIMNFFLQDVTVGGIINDLGPKLTDIWAHGDIAQQNPMTTIGKGMGWVFFNVMATIVFFLFTVVFAFRYIALWILVILSPLAFICYIFPYTKKWFDQWMDQFIQWCIIGIPAAFTLWLGEILIQNTKNGGFISEPGTTEAGLAAFTQPLMWYAVPILFMIGGFLITLKTSAMGAGAAKRTAEVVGVGALGVTAKRSGVVDKLEEWRTAKTPEKGELEEQTGSGFRGKLQRGRIRSAQALKRLTGGWATRGFQRLSEKGEGVLGRRAYEQFSPTKQRIQDEKNRAKDREPEENAERAQTGGAETQIGALAGAIAAGQMKALRKLGITGDNIEGIAKKAIKKGDFESAKDIITNEPDISWDIAKGLSEEQREKVELDFSPEDVKEYVPKALRRKAEQEGWSPEKRQREYHRVGLPTKLSAEASAKDVANWSPDVLDDPRVERGVHMSSPQVWSKLGQEFGREAVRKLNEGMQNRGADWYKKHKQEGLLHYIRGTGGQNLGLEEIQEEGNKTEEQLLKKLTAETVKTRKATQEGASFRGAFGPKTKGGRQDEGGEGTSFNRDESKGPKTP